MLHFEEVGGGGRRDLEERGAAARLPRARERRDLARRVADERADDAGQAGAVAEDGVQMALLALESLGIELHPRSPQRAAAALAAGAVAAGRAGLRPLQQMNKPSGCR